MEVRLTHIGGPTVLIEFGGWRLLTHPTFDPAGGKYRFGWGTGSEKLAAPSIAAGELGPIDAVLLSHDHHDDNLEVADRLEVGTAMVHLGGVRFPVTGPLRYTMTAAEAIELLGSLQPQTTIPIHYEGWRHFRQDARASKPSSMRHRPRSANASAGCRSEQGPRSPFRRLGSPDFHPGRKGIHGMLTLPRKNFFLKRGPCRWR